MLSACVSCRVACTLRKWCLLFLRWLASIFDGKYLCLLNQKKKTKQNRWCQVNWRQPKTKRKNLPRNKKKKNWLKVCSGFAHIKWNLAKLLKNFHRHRCRFAFISDHLFFIFMLFFLSPVQHWSIQQRNGQREKNCESCVSVFMRSTIFLVCIWLVMVMLLQYFPTSNLNAI